MTADNIITMPTPLHVLAEQLRTDLDDNDDDRQKWIERTLRIASRLAEARACFKSNKEFSYWMVDAELERISPDDRVALLGMAAHAELARIVLSETTRWSWQWIWREEIEPRLRHVTKIADVSPNRAETAPISAIAANPAPEPSTFPDRPSVPPAKVAVPRRSPFYGLPRAEEVYATFTDSRTRSTIGVAIADHGGKEIWSLILCAIDHGFLTPTDMTLAKVTARILFPAMPRSWCQKFDLTNTKIRIRVRDILMPAAIANRDAILAAPNRIEEILEAHMRQQAMVVRQADDEQRSAAAVHRLPSAECEIVIFGERLWPRADNATYDFDQLRCAVWYFRDLNTWLSGSRDGANVGSRALILRLTTKWFGEYVPRAFANSQDQAKIRRVFTLIDSLTRLLEQNPHGECKWPPTPTAEGQW
jgi:hypothetical protein